jgi:hypothetical protein
VSHCPSTGGSCSERRRKNRSHRDDFGYPRRRLRRGAHRGRNRTNEACGTACSRSPAGTGTISAQRGYPSLTTRTEAAGPLQTRTPSGGHRAYREPPAAGANAFSSPDSDHRRLFGIPETSACAPCDRPGRRDGGVSVHCLGEVGRRLVRLGPEYRRGRNSVADR